MAGDNHLIDVTSDGEKALLLALQFVAIDHTKFTHCCVHPKYGMVLFWTARKDFHGVPVVPFLCKMTPELVVPMVHGWLITEANYGPQPDHDGDNKKGFRLYNEAWGHVGDHWEACCAIQPVWQMYGK